MRSSIMQHGLRLCATIVALFASTACITSAQGQGKPMEAPAEKAVDERLFLFYQLADLYMSWPGDMSDKGRLELHLGALRHRANRLLEYAKRAKMDDEIVGLYQDFIEREDAFVDFLVVLNVVERSAIAKAELNAATVWSNTIKSSGEAVLVAVVTDNPLPAVVGIADAAKEHYLDNMRRRQELSETVRRNADAALRVLKDKASHLDARTEVTALTLADRYHWDKRETGFHNIRDNEDADMIQKAMAEGDYKTVLGLLDKAHLQRPRDPAVIASRCLLWSVFSRDREPAVILRYAKDCVDAVGLVPKHAIYDDYRGQLLAVAGTAADVAAKEELGAEGFAAARSTRVTTYAVACWDAALKYCDQDPTGEFRESRAWALARDGKLADAQKQAMEVWEKRRGDVDFLCQLACLSGAIGDSAAAVKLLQRAAPGFAAIHLARLRRDADLAVVRSQRAADYAALTTVRASWDINFGVLNDDVMLKNESPFPLTGVVLRIQVKAKGRTFDRELKVARVEPGDTATWVDAISIPGSRTDERRSALSCEQEPPSREPK